MAQTQKIYVLKTISVYIQTYTHVYIIIYNKLKEVHLHLLLGIKSNKFS